MRRLLDLEQDRLKEALHLVGQIDLIVKNALEDVVLRPGRGPTLVVTQKATRRPRTRTLPE